MQNNKFKILLEKELIKLILINKQKKLQTEGINTKV